MTDNLPAVREIHEIAHVDTDSWTSVVGEVAKLASYIADTEFVPKGLKSPAAVAAAILYGREVGLAPMTALNMTHVVEGRPGISAEGMRALVLAQGHEIEVVETTGALCTMRARRRGSETWTPITWTLDMARAAELQGKNNWRKHPRQMLQARTTTELCRLVFPDVIHGFRSLEELEDMADGDVETTAAPALAGTSRVGRRGARKTAAALPPAAAATAERPQPPVGVPLPGEPGYEDSSDVGAGVVPEPASEVQSTEEPGSGDDVTTGPGDVGNNEDPGSSEHAGGDAVPGGTAAPGSGEEGKDEGEASEPSPPRATSPRKSSAAQRRMIMARWKDFGVDPNDRDERLMITSRLAGRDVGSTNDLSSSEASAVIDTLARLKDREELMRLLDTMDEADALRAAAERGEDAES